MSPADLAEMKRRLAAGDPISLIINAEKLAALIAEVERGREREDESSRCESGTLDQFKKGLGTYE